jgi:hypothetical protein
VWGEAARVSLRVAKAAIIEDQHTEACRRQRFVIAYIELGVAQAKPPWSLHDGAHLLPRSIGCTPVRGEPGALAVEDNVVRMQGASPWILDTIYNFVERSIVT